MARRRSGAGVAGGPPPETQKHVNASARAAQGRRGPDRPRFHSVTSRSRSAAAGTQPRAALPPRPHARSIARGSQPQILRS